MCRSSLLDRSQTLNRLWQFEMRLQHLTTCTTVSIGSDGFGREYEAGEVAFEGCCHFHWNKMPRTLSFCHRLCELAMGTLSFCKRTLQIGFGLSLNLFSLLSCLHDIFLLHLISWNASSRHAISMLHAMAHFHVLVYLRVASNATLMFEIVDIIMQQVCVPTITQIGNCAGVHARRWNIKWKALSQCCGVVEFRAKDCLSF